MALKVEVTRELILKVATELFVKKGFKSATMSDMDSATTLTKGAFYHHFKYKTEILEAAVKQIINGLRLKMDQEAKNQ